MTARVIRGRIFSFTGDPAESGSRAYSLIEDGAILVAGGLIEAVGEARDILKRAPPGALVDDHSGCLISSGFIDAHIHYSQTQVTGSYGAQLLDWLYNYTFVEEQRFADPEHCARMAAFFLDELIRSGTTTAMVYCTVHPASVDAFFAEAQARSMRMIAGKVMMDRDAPEALMDTAERGYDESKALIERWRGRGRLDYAITPRFAVTSTEAQLDAAGALKRQFPDAYVQTHANENKAEIARVAALFPEARSYTAASTRGPGFLGPARSSAIAFICRRAKSRRSPKAAPSPLSARRRNWSSAPACSMRRASARQACGLRSRPTLAGAPAIRCCAPPPRATRCCSSTASHGRRSRPSIK